MRCVRDIRSSFVAGISTSYGYAFGYHHVCNDGGVNTYIGLPGQAQVYIAMNTCCHFVGEI
jgi:hypothetical protein